MAIRPAVGRRWQRNNLFSIGATMITKQTSISTIQAPMDAACCITHSDVQKAVVIERLLHLDCPRRFASNRQQWALRPAHITCVVPTMHPCQHQPITAYDAIRHLIPLQAPCFSLCAHTAPFSCWCHVDGAAQLLAAQAQAKAGGKVEGEEMICNSEKNFIGQKRETSERLWLPCCEARATTVCSRHFCDDDNVVFASGPGSAPPQHRACPAWGNDSRGLP